MSVARTIERSGAPKGNLGRDPRRWPLQPLLQYGCDDVLEVQTIRHLARRVGASERTVWRWRLAGLTDQAADWAAIALGVHPCMVWPDWFQVVEPDWSA